MKFFSCGNDASDPGWNELLCPIAKIPPTVALTLVGLEEDLKVHLLDPRNLNEIAGRDTLGVGLTMRGELMASDEKGWKAKYGVASVNLMVAGKVTVLKVGSDKMLAQAVDIVQLRRKTADSAWLRRGRELRFRSR